MSPSQSPRPVIALDADGVLVDYNKTWGRIHALHFGEELTVADPNAYHAVNYWGKPWPAKDSGFWDAFIAHNAWGTMDAKDGAVEACHRLHSLGFDLVCVTSMPPEFAHERLANLKQLGFPIDRVIAPPRKDKPVTDTDRRAPEPFHPANPKLDVIHDLMPAWFVDDEYRKLRGIEGVNLVLIDPGHPDTPNADAEHDKLAFHATSLLDFAAWLEVHLAPKVKTPSP
jgi:FMN phosphatase YigB (HAD superfamily)